MGIISTEDSGLAGGNSYYFKINNIEYLLPTDEGTVTYVNIVDLINNNGTISAAGFKAKIVQATGGEDGEDIRIYNDAVRGSGSECTLTNGTSVPDLFANLNFWPTFRKDPVYGLGQVTINVTYSISGEALLSGSAITSYEVLTTGTAFYGDTYYQDEYYGE